MHVAGWMLDIGWWVVGWCLRLRCERRGRLTDGCGMIGREILGVGVLAGLTGDRLLGGEEGRVSSAW